MAPSEFLDHFIAFLHARQFDSRSTDYFVPVDAPPPPDLLLRFGYFTLRVPPEFYLGEVCGRRHTTFSLYSRSFQPTSAGRRLLIKKRELLPLGRNVSEETSAEFIFGNDFLRAYCISLDFGPSRVVPTRLRFAISYAFKRSHSLSILITLLIVCNVNIL